MDTVKEMPAALARRPGLVLLAASVGVLIAQIDTSVVSLAVKRIGADLGSTGQSGAAGAHLDGLRPAMAVGGAAELVGAVVAVAFITRHSGHPA